MNRFSSPGGTYMGFDNYDSQPRRTYKTQLNGQLVDVDIGPGGMPSFGEPAQRAEAPSETDMLMRQFQAPPKPDDFVNQTTGNVPVGLSHRPFAKNPNFVKLWQSNPDEARRIYTSLSGGVSPEEDAYADENGLTQLAQLRAAMRRPAEMKADRDVLSGIESQFGFNSGLLLRDLYNPGNSTGENWEGYDEVGQRVWVPQRDRDGNPTRSKEIPVDPAVRARAQQVAARLYGYSPRQTATQMPSAIQQDSHVMTYAQQRRAELERKRNAPSADWGNDAAFGGAMY